MDNILVIMIVILACAFIARTFHRRSKKEGDCSCGCSTCDADITCNEPTKDKPQNL